MSRNESVDELRIKIDQIDEKVVNLLNDRAVLAQRIGQTKSLSNQEVYVPQREQDIIHRLAGLSRGPLPYATISSIYREIISGCRSLEAPLKVAYFGAAATYSHLAAKEKFGSSSELRPTASIPEVFQEVSQDRVSFGVVPIENSTEGVVAHTLDCLVESDLRICAEIFLDIHHHLLSQSGRADEVRRIISHPQALAQCRDWLGAHFPNIAVEEVASTAHAALAASKDGNVAAISSALAKEVYGLESVASNIEDRSNNITRFLVIGKMATKPGRRDKTSLVFSAKDKPGVLYQMLQPFAKSRINLCKIESRPIKNKPWEYLFFLDLLGHREQPAVKRAIAGLEKNCVFFKILGSYPSGR
ncbi:MAG TPA: prephenate dehydratase [Candidatus Limnocylindrales bacterium]|nr:prephenate dehydratase [Candidatus Limnocylindrales bacterium]